MSNSELIFGFHAVNAIFKQQPERFIELFVLKGREDERLQPVLNKARKFGISIQFMNRKAMDDKSSGEQHQGIIARVKPGKQFDETDLDQRMNELNEPAFFLVLDGVTDPHNLGACLRSADAAGAHGVIVTKDKSARITPVVRKVASGAAETVPLFQVTNLARTLRHLQEQGVWITGTAGETEKLVYQQEFTGPTAIVMGAEGKGLRRLTRETCDELVKIPMAGSVSSLNVSVATGICLFEVVRQRNSQ